MFRRNTGMGANAESSGFRKRKVVKNGICADMGRNARENRRDHLFDVVFRKQPGEAIGQDLESFVTQADGLLGLLRDRLRPL